MSLRRYVVELVFEILLKIFNDNDLFAYSPICLFALINFLSPCFDLSDSPYFNKNILNYKIAKKFYAIFLILIKYRSRATFDTLQFLIFKRKCVCGSLLKD